MASNTAEVIDFAAYRQSRQPLPAKPPVPLARVPVYFVPVYFVPVVMVPGLG